MHLSNICVCQRWHGRPPVLLALGNIVPYFCEYGRVLPFDIHVRLWVKGCRGLLLQTKNDSCLNKHESFLVCRFATLCIGCKVLQNILLKTCALLSARTKASELWEITQESNNTISTWKIHVLAVVCALCICKL